MKHDTQTLQVDVRTFNDCSVFESTC